MRALQEYPWPGNIRELKNVLERSLLLSDRRRDPAHPTSASNHRTGDGAADDTRLTLTEVESRHILRVLKEEEGVIDRAAKRLGITRNTLYYKVRKHRITLRKQSTNRRRSSRGARAKARITSSPSLCAGRRGIMSSTAAAAKCRF